ncbi:MAG TPA: SDR family oxidoreductase [Capsulimonadaceae bacterium]|nr:SDR family oxidoreductase [Capsulimonadaceae bacterium]
MSDLPAQHQDQQPGLQTEMAPQPKSTDQTRKSCGKLDGKAALITGGDSGIGRAVAVAFAKEGADVAIVYLNEHEDAKETQRLVEAEGRSCVAVAGDVADDSFCRDAVEKAVNEFGHLDVLVNNAGEQHPQESLEDISKDQLLRTFETNIFAQFYMTQAALQYMRDGAAIINTTSVTAYQGSPNLIDYSSTKGAIVSFTRALSNSLVKKKIRVNAVAPGPIWTPLIPASYAADKVSSFGKDVPMGRPGQPDEVAPCYVFLASNDSSYMSGQVLHPDGGTVVNG